MGQPYRPGPVGSRRSNNQKYFLTDAGRQMIVDRYDGRTTTTKDLAAHLEVPRWAVQRWAMQLGLTKPRDRHWTPQDEAALERNMHRMSLKALAKKLGRSEAAIRLRATRLGINKHQEGYTLRGLCLAFGCDSRTIAKWTERGWLRGKRRQTERKAVGDIWYFSEKDVRKFVMQHPEAIDQRKVNFVWLVDVLTGGIGPLPGDKGESEQ